MIGKKTILGLFAVYLAYHLSKNRKITGEIVATNNGKLQGIVSLSRDGREFYQWLGVPYAKPPVGANRFEISQPADKWDGVRDAGEYGSGCIQLEWFSGVPFGSEDCLFLNIHVPKAPFQQVMKKKRKPLPVMFWIHGGYFACGFSDWYMPDYFMDEDVIVVTINYRLGTFGFLSTGDGLVRGNMGLKDQSLALRWVKENIGNFGGNPDEITVFGESAGGVSTYFHMISPMSKGLFARGISQSASVRMPHYLYDDPVGQLKKFAKNVGCPTDSVPAAVDCFRKTDAETLLQGHVPMVSPERSKIDVFGPVVEAINDKYTFLAEHPDKILAKGAIEPRPWLTGVTSDEGVFYSIETYRNQTFRRRLMEDWKLVERSQAALDSVDPVTSAKIRNFYFGSDKIPDNFDPADEATFETLVKMSSDRFFLNPTHKSIGIHSKIAPVYTYYYAKHGPSIIDVFLAHTGETNTYVESAIATVVDTWNENVLGQSKRYFGVAHADELAMQFVMPGVFHVPANSPYYAFSKEMVKSWVSFAKGEHPQFKGVKFPKVTSPDNIDYLYMDDEPKIVKYPHLDRYNFWDRLNLV